jgi:hypothetical protein
VGTNQLNMTYEYLKNLKKYNQTFKLLNSDNFSMMVSFFHFVFVLNKHISIKHTDILNYLEDFLYDINQSYNGAYPKVAKAYLDDFVNDKNGYLKKYHGSDDEPMYELTPYSQKVFEIVESLDKKEFVGSRTKFNIIFELLEELEFETNLSDEDRIKTLENDKKEIDKQIENIKMKTDIRFDNSRIKEHFMLLVEQSTKLKYDFSQIEYNFKELNQKAMEKIATNNDSKDNVLDSIFNIEDSIRQTDQGKSFFAFWQLLTDANKNEKLTIMLNNLYKIDVIKEFDTDESLKNLKYELLQNADKITKVSSKLIEQLRRFLDDRVWIENKKILDICKSIENTALKIKTKTPTQKAFMGIDDTKIYMNSIFEKSLFSIKKTNEFTNELKEDSVNIDLDSFYDIFFIDEQELKNHINYFLQIKPICTLEDILVKFPIQKGIAEIVSYLSIAKNSTNATVELDNKISLRIEDENGYVKMVKIPKIVFIKNKK